jgi:hypothetical protein
MTLLLATITAILFAAYEAREIKRRIALGIRDKLDHAGLTIVRLCVAMGCAIAASNELNALSIALNLLLFAAVFAPVHRLVLNLWRGMPWYWMGGDERNEDDSKYDTFWHWLTCDYHFTTHNRDGEEWQVYEQKRPFLPFVTAVVFEIGVALFTISYL